MAINTTCAQCGVKVTTSVRNKWPLCDSCKRKKGWKPWDEMSLEEKVEDLNRRFTALSILFTPLG